MTLSSASSDVVGIALAIGNSFNVLESSELLTVTVPEMCETDFDDFDATVDRYWSMEETSIPPPPLQEESYATENVVLLHRIIFFVGKEENAPAKCCVVCSRFLR